MNRQRWGLLFRLLLSVILIGGLVHYAGSDAIVQRVKSVPWYTLALAIVIIGTSFVFVTPRWTLILAAFGHRVRARDLTGSVIVGFLFNQLLPTAVGGEVVRIWRARQLSVSLDVAIYSVLVDRASGVFVSLACAVLLLPFASPLSGKGGLGWILNAVAIAGIVGATVLWSIQRMSPPRSPILARLQTSVAKIWMGLNAIVSSPGRLFGIAALACINQGLLVAAVWLFAHSLTPGLNFADIAFITFVSTVASTLPLSFAGWGIREATLVYLFSLYGVPPDIALAISILYGVSVALAAAPGALFLIRGFKPSNGAADDTGSTVPSAGGNVAAARSTHIDDWDRHWKDIEHSIALNPGMHYRSDLIRTNLNLRNDRDVRLLDVGSGIGDFLVAIAGQYPDVSKLGLELSQSGVDIAQHRLPHATFIQKDLTTAQDDPGQYRNFATHALCSEVLEHVDDPVLLLKNARHYMADKCRLVVTVPGGPRSALDLHIGHRRHFTPDELRQVLTDAGFKVEFAVGAGFPFFNLYRLLVILWGQRLVKETSGRPGTMLRSAAAIFRVLFRLNRDKSRLGWQIMAVATR